jgi:archaellum component FlaC
MESLDRIIAQIREIDNEINRYNEVKKGLEFKLKEINEYLKQLTKRREQLKKIMNETMKKLNIR